ncbi:FAD-linked oxidase C-terminal domain-containing protein, partial [Bacillus sp. D-CC]
DVSKDFYTRILGFKAINEVYREERDSYKLDLCVGEEFAQIGLPTDVKAILLIEQDGPPEVVNRDIEKMANVCRSMNAVDVRVAKDEAEADALRTARRSALS